VGGGGGVRLKGEGWFGGGGGDVGGWLCDDLAYGIDLASGWTDIERKILDRWKFSILNFSHYRVSSSLVHFVFFHQVSLNFQIRINIIVSSLLQQTFLPDPPLYQTPHL
jgi:hypothetical protein